MDVYLGADAARDAAIAAMAALSGVSDRWIFDGHDAEAWIAAIAASEAGWIAWYDTGIPDFPLKFDVTLLNGRDPLDLARSLGRRLNCPVAVPDEQSHDPDLFLLLESDGAGGVLRWPLGRTAEPASRRRRSEGDPTTADGSPFGEGAPRNAVTPGRAPRR